MDFFSQNNLRYLDLSCKTDLDTLDCFGRKTPILKMNKYGKGGGMGGLKAT